MRLALLVLVYHMVKILIVVKICPAREQIPDAVWHSGKELVSVDVGHLSDHGRDIDLGHVCVMWECLGKARGGFLCCPKSKFSSHSPRGPQNPLFPLQRMFRALQVGLKSPFLLRSPSLHRNFWQVPERMARTETTGRNCITVHPEEGKHSATIIVCHGLGDSADGWIDVAESWARAMPWVKFIVPSAASRAITMNGGFEMPGWYDIVGLDDRSGESCEGIDDSIQEIRDIMATEHALGIPYNRMMLSGFSQGGALSLFCGLQLPIEEKLAGILVMSGYCPGYSKFKLTPGLEDVPFLHCHGTADPVVRYEWAKKTKAHVEGLGFKGYELKEYPGMQHSACPEEIQYALDFLKRCLVDDPSLALKAKDPSEMTVKELKKAIAAAGLNSKTLGFNEKSEFVNLLTAHREGNVFV